MIQKTLPAICPSCQGCLKVQKLTCDACGTSVEGSFELPVLCRLPAEDQEFILHLIQASGSLKELASRYKLSYPTIRNRLDALIDKISQIASASDQMEE